MQEIDRRWLIFGAIGILVIAAGLIIAITRISPQAKKDSPSTTPLKAIKIGIAHEGIYRLTSEDFRNFGADFQQFAYASLNLSQGGDPIPYTLIDEGLVFYGQAPDSRYSPYRAYILEIGKPGVSINSLSASLNATQVANTVNVTIHFEENTLYDGRTREEDANGVLVRDPWYWANITVADRRELELKVPHDSKGPAILAVALWGVTENAVIVDDHDLEVEVNNTAIGTIRWDGEGYYVGQLTVPAGILQAGSNIISLDNSKQGSAPIDIMHLDWIELTATVSAKAIDDRLTFQVAGSNVKIDGFSGIPLFLDITNPDQPVILNPAADSDDGPALGETNSKVIAGVGPTGYFKPEFILPIRDSSLKDTENRADLIVISPRSLSNDLEPFLKAREAQGLTVALANVDEIYDVFGFGEPGPESIAAFIRFAGENWRDPKPRYILLVGEATYDYRGYLGVDTENLVPSPMVAVQFGGETVSDARLADVDGDEAPDMAIGRWPVDSPTELRSLIDRTLAYEQGAAASKAIFAADGSDPSFSMLNDDIALSSGFDLANVERLVGPTGTALIESWNQGAWLITYTGHGSLERWSKEDMFTSDAVSRLRLASAPPIVLQLTCLTGYFAHPTTDSISEMMMLDRNGPVTIIAATSLTLSQNQRSFGTNFLAQLRDPTVERIGDAFHRAKRSLDISNNAMREISDTFGLLGDPTTRIVRPEGNNSLG